MSNATGCGEIPARIDDLWTGEVAALAGVAKMTIVRWANAGKIASRRTAGGDRRFAPYDVAELLDSIGRPVPPDIRAAWRIEWHARRAES